MKKLLLILEGTLIGLLVSGFFVITGAAISGTWVGMSLTLIFCTLLGGLVNRFSGACAGIIAGCSVYIIGDMVSQSTFGMVTTLLAGAIFGSLVAWELTKSVKPNTFSAEQSAR